jgi:hypothetical protein
MIRLIILFIKRVGKKFGFGVDKTPTLPVKLNSKTTNERQQMSVDTTLENKVTPTVEELQSKVDVLQLVSKRQYDKLDKVKQIVSDLIENNEIMNDEAVGELNTILELNLTRTVEVVVKSETTVSIELPLGTEVDEWDFDVTEIQYNGDSVDIVDGSILSVDEA